ncbi:DUF2268 domain-containing protein [Evansella cellulosilytica]|uniref:DUF2268 domain-containing protein n=1 Tax=Evansella cellulosilytica (strain ATCC 21833 / DSM 2522 / FERM P-1141 / JCM 9156 / N-4) TaxID=649639 RepID=E6TX77_EVAC2|nr:DUF2268 domain-containing putative Zn-dependent protease [Evansella cellulosilytica]ADU31166.1 Protein of unknown function DUF2268, Zn-dependent protease-related protein [Evansella cellulosilytica DSM 2522]
MPIIPSRIWIRHLFNEMTETGLKRIPRFQALMKHKQDWKKDEWLLFLYQQGMMPIHRQTKTLCENWMRGEPNKGLRKQYDMLIEKFAGPDVDIFAFPINTENEALMNVMEGKNGITFPNFIILFFQEGTSIKEKQALLTHEYHHACRLYHQNNDEKSVTLLESFIMEGLAEWEVKKIVGEKYVSPWMTRYTRDELLAWWKRGIKEKRNIRGRENHHQYLYGGFRGYPKWLGYCLGYRMVESFIENHGEVPAKKLIKINPETICNESIFSNK